MPARDLLLGIRFAFQFREGAFLPLSAIGLLLLFSCIGFPFTRRNALCLGIQAQADRVREKSFSEMAKKGFATTRSLQALQVRCELSCVET